MRTGFIGRLRLFAVLVLLIVIGITLLLHRQSQRPVGLEAPNEVLVLTTRSELPDSLQTTFRKLFPRALFVDPLSATNVLQQPKPDRLLILLHVSELPITWWPLLEKLCNENQPILFWGHAPFRERAQLDDAGIARPEKDFVQASASHAQPIDQISGIAGWEFRDRQGSVHGHLKSGSGPIPGWNALEVEIRSLVDWHGLALPITTSNPLPTNFNSMLFWARSLENATRLLVEGVDEKGVTWRKSVPLFQNWTPYLIHERELTPNTLQQDGQHGSEPFRFQSARELRLGLSKEEDLQVGYPLRFALSDLRWLEDTRAYDYIGKWPKIPLVAPPSRIAEVTAKCVRSIRSGSLVSFPSATPCSGPYGLADVSEGKSGQTSRWIPLWEALDEEEAHLGWPVSVFVSFAGHTVTQRIGWIGLLPDFPAARLRALVSDVVGQLFAPVMIKSAQCTSPVQSPESNIVVDVHVGNWADTPASANITAELISKSRRTAERRFSVATTGSGHHTIPLGLPPRSSHEDDQWVIRIRISDTERRVLDSMEIPIFIAAASAEQEEPWMVMGTHIVHRGRKIFLYGANYSRSRIVPTTDDADAQHCLSNLVVPSQPLLEEDLDRLREFDMNVIKVSYSNLSEAPDLIRLIRTAATRGIRVWVELPCLNPLNPDYEMAQRMLEALQTAGQNNIAVIDLGRLPVFANEFASDNLGDARERWLLEQKKAIDGPMATTSAAPRQEGGASLAYTQATARTWYEAFARDFVSQRVGHIVRILRLWGYRCLVTASLPSLTELRENSSHVFLASAIGAGRHLDFLTLTAGRYLHSSNEQALAQYLVAFLRGTLGGKPIVWEGFTTPALSWANSLDLRNEAKAYADFFAMVSRTRAQGALIYAHHWHATVPDAEAYAYLSPDARWFYLSNTLRSQSNRLRTQREFALPLPSPLEKEFSGSELISEAEEYARLVSLANHRDVRHPALGKRISEWQISHIGAAGDSRLGSLPLLSAEWGRTWVNEQEVLRPEAQPLPLRRGDKLRVEAVNTGWLVWEAGTAGKAKTIWVELRRDGTPVVRLPLPLVNPGKSATVTWTATDPGLWTFRIVCADVGEFGEPLHLSVTE